MMTRGHTSLLATSALASEAAAAALLWAGPGAHGGPAGCSRPPRRTRSPPSASRPSCGDGRQRLEIEAAGRGAWLLFALVSAVLPLVGPLALERARWRAWRGSTIPRTPRSRTRRSRPTWTRRSPLPASRPTSAPPASRRACASIRDPASRRAAVLATRRLRDPADATRLLRLALRDQSEEVRLLAHALLEDRERRAYDAIEQLTRELAAAPAERRGPIACLLAEASLDLCTAGLVSGELESFTLRRARALIEDARAAAPIRASASAALLLGRVLLRQGESRDARAAFEESRRLGAPDPLTAPYFAEIAVPDPRGRAFVGAAGVTSAAADAHGFPRLAGDGVADVGLLLEGTYPYVSGGVSTWVHEIISGFPELDVRHLLSGRHARDHRRREVSTAGERRPRRGPSPDGEPAPAPPAPPGPVHRCRAPSRRARAVARGDARGNGAAARGRRHAGVARRRRRAVAARLPSRRSRLRRALRGIRRAPAGDVVHRLLLDPAHDARAAVQAGVDRAIAAALSRAARGVDRATRARSARSFIAGRRPRSS